ncbi:hypothetical protein ACN9MB_13075 [Dyella kyungheensis]|uniref:hypothetical protein n=1 Tax=Dyella kyungheensis TaxID=1242174 RepID=UPI003CE7EC0C
MKASELIKQLQAMIDEHGDRDVFTWLGDESYGKVCGVNQFDEPPGKRDDAFQVGDFYL